MALYDWPMNQYKVPNYGLLYDNVNPYADSAGLMRGAYSPWKTPAGESGWSDPWFKGPDVTWSSPDQDYADYMQKLADDEAAAIRNANNINNPTSPLYNEGGEPNADETQGTGWLGDYMSNYGQNIANMSYGLQDLMGNLQGMTDQEIADHQAQMSADAGATAAGATDAGYGTGSLGEFS